MTFVRGAFPGWLFEGRILLRVFLQFGINKVTLDEQQWGTPFFFKSQFAVWALYSEYLKGAAWLFSELP